MKRLKRALIFVAWGLSLIIAFFFGSGIDPTMRATVIQKEQEPIVYSIEQYLELFILDRAPHTTHLFEEVNLNGCLVHKNEDNHTIIIQDLENKNMYLRAEVPAEKWAKVRNIKENHSIYIIGYATHLSYFNEPVVMVRDIGKS